MIFKKKVAKGGRKKIPERRPYRDNGGSPVVEVVKAQFNQDTPPGRDQKIIKDVIFHFKDCLQNAQYSAPQAL